MARFLHVRSGIVVNIVEYGTQTPAPVAPDGDDVVPDDGTGVGAAYDVTAYLSLAARPLAIALSNSTLEVGKALRGLIAALVDEINILRQQVVGVAAFTWDPASIAVGAGLNSANIPVTGAAFGDEVAIIAPYALAGMTLTGSVVSAGNVTARLENQTGAAINLANSAAWKAVVRRVPANGYPDRTLAQARTAITNKINAGTVDS